MCGRCGDLCECCVRGVLPHSCVVCSVLDVPTPTLWLCNASTLLCAHVSVWVGVGVYARVCVGRWI